MFTHRHSRLRYAFVGSAAKKPIVYSPVKIENFRNLSEVSRDSEVFLVITLFHAKTGKI